MSHGITNQTGSPAVVEGDRPAHDGSRLGTVDAVGTALRGMAVADSQRRLEYGDRRTLVAHAQDAVGVMSPGPDSRDLREAVG